MQFGERGYAFILDENGIIFGHSNHAYVKEQQNFLELMKAQGANDNVLSYVEKMLGENKGSFEYHLDGETCLLGFHTLNNG